MTYETTIPGEDFVPFIKSATDFVGDAKVIFEDYILISSVDAANVMLVDTAVRNPNPPSAPIEVVLDLRSIAGITSVKNDVTITIAGNNRVGIKTGRMEYALPTIIEPRLNHRKMPAKEFPVKLIVDASAFVEGVEGMIATNKAIEEIMGFWFVAESEDVFYFQDKLKQYSKAVFTPIEEYTVEVFNNAVASMFAIDYIEDMIKHLKKFDTVKLCLGDNQPMIIIASNDTRKLAYAIANRVNVD